MPPPAPTDLVDHRRALAGLSLNDFFASDPRRFQRLSLRWGEWLVDLSRERLGADTLPLLEAHARSVGLENWIAALFAGEKVNLSERRPALHTALRQQDDTPLVVDGEDIVPAIRAAQARMKALAESVRAGRRYGATRRPIRAVVNIGIGGSDLGPRLVCDALGSSADAAGVAVAFVSNVDPEHLARTLPGLDPAATLFIVTSKTFTTQETLANATSARSWLADGLGGGADTSCHFVAVTGNAGAARAFGIADDDIHPLWDWVGGRYSLWSPAGLAIAIRLGWSGFAELLAGAAAMDDHFRTTPLEQNLPAVLGFVGWWNARLLGHPDRVVVPYAQALELLPPFLQQLVLESNGKRVARDGTPAAGATTSALWGAPGTNGQHAFFQWLHQGTREAPVEFIVPVRAVHPLGQQQMLLVANALAQAQALLAGRTADKVRVELASQGLTRAEFEAAVAARVCPGNRASTTILMPQLDARHLGELIALYEHRTFVEAILHGINPFDQFGVELGKTLATPIVKALVDGAPLPAATDAATRALVAHVQALGASGTRP
jgi:glucose-6-phosphate isomerase